MNGRHVAVLRSVLLRLDAANSSVCRVAARGTITAFPSPNALGAT